MKKIKVLKMFVVRKNIGTPSESADCWTEEVLVEVK